MKLTVHERLILSQLLPTEGHFADLVAIRTMRELLNFTNDENVDLEVRVDAQGHLTLNESKALLHIRDIPCSEWMTAKIQEILITKSRAGNLQSRELTLYEKFVKLYEE
jgi:hypothetical protein